MSANEKRQQHLLSGKRVIVAGAGIAGLSFVRALQRDWPPDLPAPQISVYERDPRHLPPERGNYSLALRSGKYSSGLESLQKLGLIDEVYAARAVGSDGPVLVRDRDWRTVLAVKETQPMDDLPCGRMRITRHAIRECLIQGVETTTKIYWMLACTSAVTMPDGTVEVTLSNGSKTTCDLLVVADGASSKLRGLLRPNDNLQYAGAVMIGGQATFSDVSVPIELASGGGGPVLGGDGHGLVVFPTGVNSWVWFVTLCSPSPRAAVKSDNDLKNQKYIMDEARREGKVFGAAFDQLLAATEPETMKILNAQDKPPIEHSGLSENPYIFVGDSNHAVR